MRYLSLFSGIGGFELGMQQAYENKRLAHTGGSVDSVPRRQEAEHSTRVGDSHPEGAGFRIDTVEPTCIGFSEIDKYATQIYQSHFPEHKNYGDITKINEAELPDFDLLVGGFPCQSFSIAGKRGGFNDTRGTLFFDIARILKHKQPHLLLLENVKGLLSHDEGRTFVTIISTLDELGYDLEWQVLNSKNFGVPQNRERVFIIGHLRGESRPQVFPIREADGTTDKGSEPRDTEVASTLRSRYGNGSGSHINQLNAPKHSNDRVYGADGVGPTLNTMQGGNRQPFVAIPEATREGYSEATGGSIATDSAWQKRKTDKGESDVDDGSLPRQKDMPENSLLLLWKSKSRSSSQEPRLARQFIGELTEGLSELPQQNTPFRIRRLTPTEAERLQGFPDGWTEGVSDTQRYKCIGNAVTVNVIQTIANKLK